MTKEHVQKILNHLEAKNMSFCFDENGQLWTKETASLYLLSPSAWRNRT